MNGILDISLSVSEPRPIYRRPVGLSYPRGIDLAQDATIAAKSSAQYGEAIAKALPDADHVADRWHLMESSSRALLDAVGKSMRQIRQAVGSNVVDPKLLTYAERLHYEG